MSAGGLFLNAYFVTQILCAVLYGVELMLYFQTMPRLVKRVDINRPFLMIFSTMLLVCITIFLATMCFLGQQMWVIHQGFPGGPLAYFAKYISAWPRILGATACVILELASNAVLIHRCWTVWSGRWRVILFSCLLWVALLGVAIFELYVTSVPNSGYAVRVELVYFPFCISLSIISTTLICWRILSHTRTFRRSGLGEPFASPYFILVSMIVESALPYTIFGIATLVAFVVQSDITILPMSIWVMLACISPQILILRLAQGKTWTKETAAQHPMTNTMAPAPGTVDRSHVGAQDGAKRVRLSPVDSEEEERKLGMSNGLTASSSSSK